MEYSMTEKGKVLSIVDDITINNKQKKRSLSKGGEDEESTTSTKKPFQEDLALVPFQQPVHPPPTMQELLDLVMDLTQDVREQRMEIRELQDQVNFLKSERLKLVQKKNASPVAVPPMTVPTATVPAATLPGGKPSAVEEPFRSGSLLLVGHNSHEQQISPSSSSCPQQVIFPASMENSASLPQQPTVVVSVEQQQAISYAQKVRTPPSHHQQQPPTHQINLSPTIDEWTPVVSQNIRRGRRTLSSQQRFIPAPIPTSTETFDNNSSSSSLNKDPFPQQPIRNPVNLSSTTKPSHSSHKPPQSFGLSRNPHKTKVRSLLPPLPPPLELSATMGVTQSSEDRIRLLFAEAEPASGTKESTVPSQQSVVCVRVREDRFNTACRSAPKEAWRLLLREKARPQNLYHQWSILDILPISPTAAEIYLPLEQLTSFQTTMAERFVDPSLYTIGEEDIKRRLAAYRMGYFKELRLAALQDLSHDFKIQLLQAAALTPHTLQTRHRDIKASASYDLASLEATKVGEVLPTIPLPTVSTPVDEENGHCHW